MSRWWAETRWLRFGAAPAAPTVVRDGSSRWARAWDEFERDLRALGLRRGARLGVEIGEAWVHYRVLPWQDSLVGAAQREAYARHAFEARFGSVARQWTCRSTPAAYGRATLGCAVETALLERVATLTTELGLRWVACEPALLRQAKSQVPAGSRHHWAVMWSPPWASMLLVLDGEPVHVARVPAGGAELATLLEREWYALALDRPRVPVHVVGDRREGATVLPGWSVGPGRRWQRPPAASAARVLTSSGGRA